jgi:pimeloyl-ACP methyl ester carboxylesterase
MWKLLDTLAINHVVVVGHDIGAGVAQIMTFRAPGLAVLPSDLKGMRPSMPSSARFLSLGMPSRAATDHTSKAFLSCSAIIFAPAMVVGKPLIT